MITIKVNFDFSKALRKIEGDKILELANEGVISPIAKASSDYIKAGKVSPPLIIRKGKPLFDTGALANSLKGTTKGIMGEDYGIRHMEGYKWDWDDPAKVSKKNPTVPARQFIITEMAWEQGSVNKIYKVFQDKFVKLLNKSIRK